MAANLTLKRKQGGLGGRRRKVVVPPGDRVLARGILFVVMELLTRLEHYFTHKGPIKKRANAAA